MTVQLVTQVHTYQGLSSDTKPTTGVPAGSTFYETDTSLTAVWNSSAWSYRYPFVSKTVTFTGAAGLGAVGAVPLFAVTGEILIERLIPYCTVDLGEAAPTATLALGVTGSIALLVAATNAVDIDAGEFWVDTAPDANGVALPAALKDIVVTDNIIGTVAAQAVNAGAIRFDLYWRPLTGGSVVAS